MDPIVIQAVTLEVNHQTARVLKKALAVNNNNNNKMKEANSKLATLQKNKKILDLKAQTQAQILNPIMKRDKNKFSYQETIISLEILELDSSIENTREFPQ